MKPLNALSVSDLAALSGVSIRTLHYYDKIGLLVAGRRPSGYRIYDHSHVLLLQQILLQKSMGLSLDAIKVSLNAADFDVMAQLKSQKEVLLKRAEDTRAMIAVVDAAIAKSLDIDGETTQSLQSLFEGFDPALYEAEVQERWGRTRAFKTSQSRTKKYTSEEWTEIKSEESAIWTDAAQAFTAGQQTDSEAAGKLAERHRQHIDRWYYETSEAGYASLADIWENDARFIANIDKYGTGLSGWFAEAVRHKYLTI